MSCLYIHIPFCLSKCPYCSFVSYPDMNNLHQRYAATLLREAEGMRRTVNVAPLSTLFMGGGTPTILDGMDLAEIVTGCVKLFGLSAEAEISVEANPKTIDPRKLARLRQSGVNRLSIGAQSFNDNELRLLGRPHNAEDALQAVHLARAAGFANISIDLMYGLPGQTPDSWQSSLKQALALAPAHLSLYELTIEPGTPYFRQQAQDRLKLPDEGALMRMDRLTATLCQEAGLIQYEISNYAVPGFGCRHNINYWRNGPYLALGAGAVACVAGCRRRSTSDPLRYCELVESGRSVIVEEEVLEPDASFRETVVMGLRMVEGVTLEELRGRYGWDVHAYYGTPLSRLVERGLVELNTDCLRLTARGRLFANQVMAELV